MPLPLGDTTAVAAAAPEATLPLVFLNDFDFTEEGALHCIAGRCGRCYGQVWLVQATQNSVPIKG